MTGYETPYQQLTQIQAGNLLTLTYEYSAGQNNGNVASQTITRPDIGTWTQSYDAYDGVNRLTAASESGAGSWSESYSYDGFGNRGMSRSGALPGLTMETPAALSWYSAANRIVGWGYDAAGNLTSVPNIRTLAYDAENRQITATMSGGQPNSYAYDADGRRVTKTTPAGTTRYVYDAMGQLAAEYGAAPAESGTRYLTADALGSTRLVTDENGTCKAAYDYLPFGEEIAVNFAGRTFACYGGTSYPSATPGIVSEKFTGKERDAETGLDYFGARYMSSAQGRFTTADPLMASAKASNPQTWNRYSYALNNPLRYIDRDGLDVPEDCAKDPKCTIKVKVNVIYDKTVNRGRGLTAEQKKQFEQGQIAQAKKDYGTSNIQLDVTYTHGSYTVGANGQPQITGTNPDALNLVVSNGTPTGSEGVSGADRNTGVALTFLNFNDVHDTNKGYSLFVNTTEHELGHQFLGDVFQQKSGGIGGFFQYLGREAAIDTRIKGQANGISQEGFRTGLEPRRYAVPANPEANKPRQ